VHPSARYYLYFSHHNGWYIRMAWSVDVAGPYHLYQREAIHRAGRGVFELAEVAGARRLQFGNGVVVHGHVASPDVHVDHRNRRFVMYFHGITNTTTPPPHLTTGPQKTLVATSADGLDFGGSGTDHDGPRPALLGNAYFRVFHRDEWLYAFSNGGELWRCRRELAWTPADPPTADAWERGPNPVLDALQRRVDQGPEAGGAPGGAHGSGVPAAIDPRHFAVRYVTPKSLEVFYSIRGAMNESIERVVVDVGESNWHRWTAEGRECVLTPELDWEGAHHPPAPSRPGGETGVRQLRDPAVLTEADGSAFLFYSGAGEEAIGVARLVESI
jgi:hypothetical protein